MKSLRRLALFFSVWFVVILPVAAVIRYLHGWIDASRHVSAEAIEIFASAISAGTWALPVALYASIFLSLSYSVYRSFPGFMSILCVFLLSGGFTTGVCLALLHAESSLVLPGKAAPPALGAPGLILTQGNTTVILLDKAANPAGPRVIAVPDRPLIYQSIPAGPVRSSLTLPAIPFRIGEPYFMTSLSIDFSLAGKQFRNRLGEGIIPFGMYLGSLCLLLVSLRFVLKLTSWPLANIFLGALVFRGVLAAETFLDSGEIRRVINLFLKADIPQSILPQSIITPLVFCGAAMVIIMYTTLAAVIRSRRSAP